MTTTEYLSTTTLARINADGTVRVFVSGDLVGTFVDRDAMRVWWDEREPKRERSADEIMAIPVRIVE